MNINNAILMSHNLIAMIKNDIGRIKICNYLEKRCNHSFVKNYPYAKINSLKLVGEHLLASGHSDGSIKVWNVTSKKFLGSLKNQDGRNVTFLDVGVYDKKHILISGSRENTKLKIWNLKKGYYLGDLETNIEISALILL